MKKMFYISRSLDARRAVEGPTSHRRALLATPEHDGRALARVASQLVEIISSLIASRAAGRAFSPLLETRPARQADAGSASRYDASHCPRTRQK